VSSVVSPVAADFDSATNTAAGTRTPSVPPTPLTISTRIVSRIVAAAASRGVDTDALLQSVGFEPADVADVDGRVDQTRYLQLWSAVVEVTKDPAFALEVARSCGEQHNLLRFICMTSANLGEAFERASRYLRVMTDSVSWPVENHGPITILTMVRHGEVQPECRFADEFGAGEIVALARMFTGAPWDPIEVRFTHAAPESTAAHETFFGAPVRFGCARSEIRFATSTLQLPLVKADPPTVAFFEPYIDKILEQTPTKRSLAEDVRDVLSRGLRGEAPSLDQVAERLEMSGRTLRRRLQLEGTTFQAILDATRFEVAREHLASRRLSFAEISFLLGFSEPSAFHRAFRRWTGTTPQAFARSERGRSESAASAPG